MTSNISEWTCTCLLYTSFNGRGQFWGQSPVNQGVVTGPAYDQLQHTIRGLNSDGTPMHADDIQNRIDGAQTSLASYQKTPNADPAIVAQTQTDIANLQACLLYTSRCV